MIVVDASAVVDALLRDGVSRRELSGRQLFAPHLIDSEVVSSLRRLVQLGEISAAAASATLRLLGEFGVTRYPVFGLTDRMWELRDNLTAYDATYVAVAEALECPLVTSDGRLARAPGVRCQVTLLPA